ncbi:MAG: NAD(P)/FAD-dependent oxidoreductase [Candidatus Kariarchaeaceae archaeon]
MIISQKEIDKELPKSADIVIIGGGVSGLGVAYELAKKGFGKIVVLEKDYFGAGATGRCGGGIRQQWNTKENIILARESVKMFKKLPGELKHHIFFRQGGYLIPAYSEEELEQYRTSVILQNKFKVKSKILTPKEVKKVAPVLDTTKFIGAAFNPSDGTAYPPALIWGYLKASRKKGVLAYSKTKVKDIVHENNSVTKVITSRGEIETNMVFNAAGAHSREVAKMVGVELPNYAIRHEILVSETLRPFLEPMVISFQSGIYFSQSNRGEIVGGIGMPEEPGIITSSSHAFLKQFAKVLVELAPALRTVRIMRQWAGIYDMTPDARPIIGEVEGLEGYYHANGYSGHGFMLSPVIAQMMSEIIRNKKVSIGQDVVDALNLKRFETGDYVKETMVVG